MLASSAVLTRDGFAPPSRGTAETELTRSAQGWFRTNTPKHVDPRTHWCAVSQDNGRYVLHLHGTRSGATVHIRRDLGATRDVARAELAIACWNLTASEVTL